MGSKDRKAICCGRYGPLLLPRRDSAFRRTLSSVPAVNPLAQLALLRLAAAMRATRASVAAVSAFAQFGIRFAKFGRHRNTTCGSCRWSRRTQPPTYARSGRPSPTGRDNPLKTDQVRVRIPRPAPCDVSGHRGHLSHDILDGCRRAEVATAWIERELAEQLTVVADDPHVRPGDEQPDRRALVRAADVDVPQLAQVAQRDAAAAIDLVVTHPEVDHRLRQLRRSGFDACAPRDQRRAPAERP